MIKFLVCYVMLSSMVWALAPATHLGDVAKRLPEAAGAHESSLDKISAAVESFNKLDLGRLNYDSGQQKLAWTPNENGKKLKNVFSKLFEIFNDRCGVSNFWSLQDGESTVDISISVPKDKKNQQDLLGIKITSIVKNMAVFKTLHESGSDIEKDILKGYCHILANITQLLPRRQATAQMRHDWVFDTVWQKKIHNGLVCYTLEKFKDSKKTLSCELQEDKDGQQVISLILAREKAYDQKLYVSGLTAYDPIGKRPNVMSTVQAYETFTKNYKKLQEKLKAIDPSFNPAVYIAKEGAGGNARSHIFLSNVPKSLKAILLTPSEIVVKDDIRQFYFSRYDESVWASVWQKLIDKEVLTWDDKQKGWVCTLNQDFRKLGHSGGALGLGVAGFDDQAENILYLTLTGIQGSRIADEWSTWAATGTLYKYDDTEKFTNTNDALTNTVLHIYPEKIERFLQLLDEWYPDASPSADTNNELSWNAIFEALKEGDVEKAFEGLADLGYSSALREVEKQGFARALYRHIKTSLDSKKESGSSELAMLAGLTTYVFSQGHEDKKASIEKDFNDLIETAGKGLPNFNDTVKEKLETLLQQNPWLSEDAGAADEAAKRFLEEHIVGLTESSPIVVLIGMYEDDVQHQHRLSIYPQLLEKFKDNKDRTAILEKALDREQNGKKVVMRLFDETSLSVMTEKDMKESFADKAALGMRLYINGAPVMQDDLSNMWQTLKQPLDLRCSFVQSKNVFINDQLMAENMSIDIGELCAGLWEKYSHVLALKINDISIDGPDSERWCTAAHELIKAGDLNISMEDGNSTLTIDDIVKAQKAGRASYEDHLEAMLLHQKNAKLMRKVSDGLEHVHEKNFSQYALLKQLQETPRRYIDVINGRRLTPESVASISEELAYSPEDSVVNVSCEFVVDVCINGAAMGLAVALDAEGSALKNLNSFLSHSGLSGIQFFLRNDIENENEDKKELTEDQGYKHILDEWWDAPFYLDIKTTSPLDAGQELLIRSA